MRKRSLAIICAILILGPYALRLQLLHTRTFDPDEFQHLHAAWMFHQGLLPFRDSFEHHMPGIQFLLSGLLGHFEVATSVDGMLSAVFAARTLMWIFAGGSIGLMFVLGLQYGGPIVGWLSAALLSTNIVFVSRTLEIRPDTPGLMFWLASLVALAAAFRTTRAGRSRRWFAASGLALGCALAFNQKLLLAGPGFLLWAAWYLRVRAKDGQARARVVNLLAFSAAVALPIAALAGYFWWRGALVDLVRGVLIDNLHWPREVTAASTIRWMLLRDPFFWALSVAGLVQALFALPHQRTDAKPTLAILLLPTLSLLGGLVVIPAPYPQYMLLVMPVAALLGSQFVWALVSELPITGRLVREDTGRASLAAALAGLVVATVGVDIARPFFVHVLVYPAFATAAGTAVLLFARRRQPELAATVLLCACSVYGVQQLRWMQGLSNADALREMRYIYSITSPSDGVLDGFTGFAWFRHSASYYPFLHPGVRAWLPPTETAAIVDLVQSCGSRPRVVLLDDQLRQLSPRMVFLVERLYQPTSFPDVWIRPDVSVDCR